MDASGPGGPKVTEHQIMSQMQTELQVAAMQEFFQVRCASGGEREMGQVSGRALLPHPSTLTFFSSSSSSSRPSGTSASRSA